MIKLSNGSGSSSPAFTTQVSKGVTASALHIINHNLNAWVRTVIVTALYDNGNKRIVEDLWESPAGTDYAYYVNDMTLNQIKLAHFYESVTNGQSTVTYQVDLYI